MIYRRLDVVVVRSSWKNSGVGGCGKHKFIGNSIFFLIGDFKKQVKKTELGFIILEQKGIKSN